MPSGGGFLIPPPEGAAEGVTVFDQTFVKSLRVRNALREGFCLFLLPKVQLKRLQFLIKLLWKVCTKT